MYATFDLSNDNWDTIVQAPKILKLTPQNAENSKIKIIKPQIFKEIVWRYLYMRNNSEQ